jgi:hypothetical protein
MWASVLVMGVFVGLLVGAARVVDASSEPVATAMAPLDALFGDVGAAVRKANLPSAMPTFSGTFPTDEGAPASPTADPSAPAKDIANAPSGFEWAWSDTEGNLHVTTTTPPDGARVISKLPRK